MRFILEKVVMHVMFGIVIWNMRTQIYIRVKMTDCFGIYPEQLAIASQLSLIMVATALSLAIQ